MRCCLSELTASAYPAISDTTLLLQEMASRHRVRAPCLQIIKTATVPAAMTKRVNVKQFHDSKIQFPLTRRLARCVPLPCASGIVANLYQHPLFSAGISHCCRVDVPLNLSSGSMILLSDSTLAYVLVPELQGGSSQR